MFTGRIDVEAETPILWPPDGKSQLIGKDPEAGKDRRQEEKRMTEDEMDGIIDLMDVSLSKLQELEFGHGQGSLVYCSPWGLKESDTTEQLN